MIKQAPKEFSKDILRGLFVTNGNSDRERFVRLWWMKSLELRQGVFNKCSQGQSLYVSGILTI